jgi:hypothetical protein
MMVRFYLRFIPFVFIIAAIVLILTRAQPYTDYDLRQLFVPENCAAPCFMGIHPGITTVDEAVQILKSSGWTADIRMQPSTSRWIVVQWNKNAPAWFRPPNVYNEASMAMLDSRIDEIHVSTALRLSDAELLFGRANATYISVFNGMTGDSHDFPVLNYSAAYISRSMLVAISQRCSGAAHITHQTPYVVLHYYSNMAKEADFLKQFQYSWQDVLHTQC